MEGAKQKRSDFMHFSAFCLAVQVKLVGMVIMEAEACRLINIPEQEKVAMFYVKMPVESAALTRESILFKK